MAIDALVSFANPLEGRLFFCKSSLNKLALNERSYSLRF